MTLQLKTVIAGKKLKIKAISVCNEEDQKIRCRTLEFVENLKKNNPKELNKLLKTLKNFADGYFKNNTEKFKYLTGTNGIYEIRSSQVRILCFKHHDDWIICTHGFLKKSRKTKKTDINQAEDLKKRFLNKRN